MREKTKRFSICIPTWEQHGVGAKYLKELFDSINRQTFRDYEIVVSDHSRNNAIFDLCHGIENLVYVRNDRKRGSGPANTNNALLYCSGQIVKIMFQDDLMCSPECLDKIDKAFTENVQWLVTGCNHTYFGELFFDAMVPRWNDKLIWGVNTIGCPSVLSFRNGIMERFDEDLVMLMDVDFYYRMYTRFGPASVVPEPLVASRIHEHQISSNYDDRNIEKERQIIRRKYST